MKLLVIGAAGQLGSSFADVTAHEIVGVTRADVDVTNHAAVTAIPRICFMQPSPAT